ncbi:hypothetical protein GGF32_007003 [Allomyces javanicus]|nr:hypothetical protein GGF32_007003 [Allomyces javanicus]
MFPPHTIVAQVSHKQYSWLYNNQFIGNVSAFLTLSIKLVMGVPLNEIEMGACKFARENTTNIFFAPNEIFNGTVDDLTVPLPCEQPDHSGMDMLANAVVGPVQVENVGNPSSNATQATVADDLDPFRELLDTDASSAGTSARLSPFWETSPNSSGMSQQSVTVESQQSAVSQQLAAMDTSYQSAAMTASIQSQQSTAMDTSIQSIQLAAMTASYESLQSAAMDTLIQSVQSAAMDTSIQSVQSAAMDTSIQLAPSAAMDTSIQSVQSAAMDTSIQSAPSATSYESLQSAEMDTGIQSAPSAAMDTSIQSVASPAMDTSYESTAAQSDQASDDEIQAAIIKFIRSHCVEGKLNEVLVSDQQFIEEFKKVNPNSKIKLSTSVLTSQFRAFKNMDGFTEIRRRRSQTTALVLKPASGNVADFVDPEYVQQCQDEIAANGCSMVGIVGGHIAGIKLKNGRNCSGKPWVGKPGKRSASSSPSPASKKKRRVTKTGVDPSFETASEVANEGSQDECVDSEDVDDDE